MKKWRKALSVALVSALLIPALTVTAFGGALGYNDILYDGYIKGNTTLGGNLTLTDPAARDLYNDLIFVTGEPGSASGSGYGSFYMGISPTTGYRMGIGYDDPITGGGGETYTIDGWSSPTIGLTQRSKPKSALMPTKLTGASRVRV